MAAARPIRQLRGGAGLSAHQRSAGFHERRRERAETDTVARMDSVGGARLFARDRRRRGGLPHRLQLFGILPRSEEHTSELQSLMRISYAVFCLKKKIETNFIPPLPI